ncbi:MAG: Hsp20/alpha crystallin family protein [Candidatus Gracilibacteria bacterium]|nr:Hsp20/alpha crystallin family protein [Candidatus Gracilibacteria bacterium]
MLLNIFQQSHHGHGGGDSHEDHGHGHGSIEVKMENDDIIEEELGQVALDILDCPDAIVIVAPIAGIDTENVDISINRNILTISGERRRPDVYDSADRILIEECFYGPFSRSVVLPENLAFNKIHADMENNLLSIQIPKLVYGEKTIKINKLER